MSKNAFFFTFLICVFQTPLFSQTLDKIIDNYLLARGQTKFNELQTLIVIGERTVINGNIKADFKEE
jgi:hypothetical protein